MDNGRKRELLEQLVDGLCAERGYEPLEAEKADELWTAFRALVNTRPPIPAERGSSYRREYRARVA